MLHPEVKGDDDDNDDDDVFMARALRAFVIKGGEKTLSIACLTDRANEANKRYVLTIVVTALFLGFQVPCCVILSLQTSRAFDRVQRTYQDLQFILAVIPNTGNKLIYQQVKQVGDTIFGVATQCVQFKHVLSPKAQVCSNIAMKINAKLGGVNHVINLDTKAPILREPVVVFGADVTHPPAGNSTAPSIAAVVASLDPNATRYCAAVRVQNSRQEIIQDLATMVKELLLQFYRKTHMKPRKIIFYRDGVSDGHFHQVLMMEVRAVQEACMMLEKGFQPGITFVIVQKRHHVRLFPADRRDACGKPGNIPPGTTVDKGITHPFEFDFYLCSHFGSQVMLIFIAITILIIIIIIFTIIRFHNHNHNRIHNHINNDNDNENDNNNNNNNNINDKKRMIMMMVMTMVISMVMLVMMVMMMKIVMIVMMAMMTMMKIVIIIVMTVVMLVMMMVMTMVMIMVIMMMMMMMK